MRLAGIEKGGFYPYPPAMAEATASWLTPAAPETHGRLLDPCAGEGEIAAQMGRLLNCETWGCELFPYRSEKAAAILDKCYGAAWESCHLTDESVTVLWLNPPYDQDRHGDDKRLEYSFLKSTTPKLVRGGLLIYVVPQSVLGLAEIARYLAGHYDEMRIWRFPDGEYERFKQITLIARRREKYETPAKEQVEMIRGLAVATLPPLDLAPAPVYTVPPAPLKGLGGRTITFRRLDWAPVDLVEATRQQGVLHTRSWDELTTQTNGNVAFTPAMPLKKGHLAMLMASGLMGTLHLNTADGAPMLVKGRVVKTVKKTTEADPHEPENEITRYKDQWVTTIATLSAEHGLDVIKDVGKLTDFMREQGEQIAAHTLLAYRPLYDMKPTAAELATLSQLGKNRRALPGQAEPGLLSTQKHVAIAAARAIRRHRAANVQGEMGLGKTTIALASVELLDAYPAIILCPPHLVPKWIREAEEVIPGVRARELRRVGLADGVEVNDVQDFLDDYRAGLLGHKAIAVVANTAAKMGTGWKPVVKAKTIQMDNGRKALVYTCPTCGQVQQDKDGTPITDVKVFQKHRCFCTGSVKGWKIEKDGRRAYSEQGAPVWDERSCEAPLFEYSESRRYSIAEYILQQAKGAFKLLVADEVHEFKAKSSDRGIAFHQLIEATDATLTLTGTFFGGRSTSIFWLLHRLNAQVRREFTFHDELRWAGLYGVLETTRKHKAGDASSDDDGTFTGNRRYRDEAHEIPGISPAIVTRLLHNTIFLNLKDLGVNLPEYTENVVTLPMGEKQAPDYTSLEGLLRQMAKENSRYLSLWLQWALARPNSAYRDEVVMLNHETIPPNVLSAIAETLLDSVNETKPTEQYQHAAKALLEAARQAQEAICQRTKIQQVKSELLPLPAVLSGSELLPKEQWLTDFCKAEKAQRRKALVYVRQTGTRDIQDRIEQTLRSAGLRATTLYGNVDPRKREAWIGRQVDSLDVLITNPRLVQTGLDLVAFSTVVFYEIEYSLYTLWQALRRVWRLGQTKPVKAIFTVYQNTLEEQALSLMGRKMRAAQLLYGDEVGGAIVEAEEGDFLTELAREVLQGAELHDLQSLFADESHLSSSAMGCPTEPSAPLVPLPPPPFATKQMSWQEWAQQRQYPPQSRRGRSKTQTGQLSLLTVT